MAEEWKKGQKQNLRKDCSIHQQAHESPAAQFLAETAYHLLWQMAAEMLV